MLGAAIDVELARDLAAETSLRKHAPNGTLDHLDGEFVEHDAGGTGAEAAVVTGDVVVVLLGLGVVAGEFHLRGIDDDDVVAAIDVRGVGGLVFAHEDDSDLGSEAAKRDVRGINDVPIVDDIFIGSQRGLTMHSNFLSDDFEQFGFKRLDYYSNKHPLRQREFRSFISIQTTNLYNCCVEKKKLEKLLDLSEQNDGYVSVKEAREKGISVHHRG